MVLVKAFVSICVKDVCNSKGEALVCKYTSGQWAEDETARHVEPLLAFVRRAETDCFRRRVLESVVGCCPREARAA